MGEFSGLYETFLSDYKIDGRDDYYNPELNRYTVFVENVLEWILHNSDTTKTWKMGMTSFADMTEDEFVDFIQNDKMG